MKALDFNGTISVATPTLYSLSLAGWIQHDRAGIAAVFDMPVSWSVDVNIDSVDATGTVDVLVSNDDPTTSKYISTPVFSYQVSAGKLDQGATKQTVDSGFGVTAKYLAIRFTPRQGTKGSGNIVLQGVIVYKEGII